ncbi:hypothetical protein Trydic_g1136 [Trypoxylus dichotomus]
MGTSTRIVPSKTGERCCRLTSQNSKFIARTDVYSFENEYRTNVLYPPLNTEERDNDPKHTTKVRPYYLQEEQAEGRHIVMECPSQFPDLNPIELSWDESKSETSYRSVDLSPGSMEHDIRRTGRMPRSCAAVIRNGGGYINHSKI